MEGVAKVPNVVKRLLARVVPRVSSTEVTYNWASSQSVSWPALMISFGLMLFSLKASTTTECSFHWREVAVAHVFHLSWTGMTPAFLLFLFRFCQKSIKILLYFENVLASEIVRKESIVIGKKPMVDTC